MTIRKTLVTLDNASVKLGDLEVLTNLTLTIEQGEFLSVIGPNGAGKSTLVNLISGGITPFRGSIVRAPDIAIGLVPQKMSVDQTIPLTTRRFLNLPHKKKPEQIDEICRLFDITSFLDRQLADLSGGQLQRVLISRALLDDPNLLILDEANTSLDNENDTRYLDILREVKEQRSIAVLTISHDFANEIDVADRLICLDRHICAQGKPDVVALTREYKRLLGKSSKSMSALYYSMHQHDGS